MAVATKAELQKKKDELDKHLKKLLDPVTGKQKHKAILNMVHSSIRSSWAIAPVKLAYYEMGRVADTDPKTLTKWKMQCECCKEWFKVDSIEIDHREGNHSFTNIEEFGSYFDNILDVEFKDLQRICKYKCHRVKSHMEKQGLPSMEFACLDKIVIFLVKHMETKELTEFLTRLGVVPESSAPKRKKQLASWLTNLGLDYDTASHFFEACDHLMRRNTAMLKAKRFSLSKADLHFLVKWRCFWGKVGTEPKTKLKILQEK